MGSSPWGAIKGSHVSLVRLATHFIDDLRVFVALGDFFPKWTRCCPRVTKVVVDLRKFVLPSASRGFDSGN
jgi:hypothetical protein